MPSWNDQLLKKKDWKVVMRDRWGICMSYNYGKKELCKEECWYYRNEYLDVMNVCRRIESLLSSYAFLDFFISCIFHFVHVHACFHIYCMFFVYNFLGSYVIFLCGQVVVSYDLSYENDIQIIYFLFWDLASYTFLAVLFSRFFAFEDLLNLNFSAWIFGLFQSFFFLSCCPSSTL